MQRNTSKRVPWALIGIVTAIAVTASMDANGLTAFSALPLLPLALIYWFVEKIPRQALGLAWSRPRYYAVAALYPVLVLGMVSWIATAAGGAHVQSGVWPKAWSMFALIAGSTIIAALLTEEGFFRGWMWASLRARSLGATTVLVVTSVAFAAWHISYATLAKGFTLPPEQVVVFIVNAAVMGAIWGLMRSMSGSIIVASLSHALWNGGAYVLFGEGPKAGLVGLPNTIVFGPEIGVIGLGANALFLSLLYWAARKEKERRA